MRPASDLQQPDAARPDVAKRPQATCTICERDYKLRNDGLLPIHKHRRRPCPGGHLAPVPGTVRPFPTGGTRDV